MQHMHAAHCGRHWHKFVATGAQAGLQCYVLVVQAKLTVSLMAKDLVTCGFTADGSPELDACIAANSDKPMGTSVRCGLVQKEMRVSSL